MTFTAAGRIQVKELSGSEVLVGRDPARDLVVADASVSRKHARL